MSFSSKNARLAALAATLATLWCSFAPVQQIAAASPDVIVPSITVQASNSAAQTAADEFLTGFISTAVRLEGAKFISCVATAAKLRPDLAAKIVVCALNIARLNSHLPGGRLSSGIIDQIIKAAVTAAPQSAADIVKAAVESEPYAREWIVAAAIAAAPDQESGIRIATSNITSMSISASKVTFNPTEDAPSTAVNSPEQPPAGP